LYYQLKVIEAKNALNDYNKNQAEKDTSSVLSFDDKKKNFWLPWTVHFWNTVK